MKQPRPTARPSGAQRIVGAACVLLVAAAWGRAAGPRPVAAALENVSITSGQEWNALVARKGGLAGIGSLRMRWQVFDADLARLRGARDLRTLVIESGCALSDRGLTVLARLPALRWLTLFDMDADARGCARLAAANLEKLVLVHVGIGK